VTRKPAGWLIPVASLLVPASFRADWREEWEAEFRVASEALRSHWRLLRFAMGSFSDALWQRKNRIEWDARPSRALQSPFFCIGSLVGIVLAVTIASGGLPTTRSILRPLSYDRPGQIATVSQGGIPTSFRSPIRPEWVSLWRHDSHTIHEFATYSWKQNGVLARVSDNFFEVLGARSDHGKLSLENGAVLSYEFFEKAERNHWIGSDGSLQFEGKRYKVAGVLEQGFWFLSRDVGIWTLDSGKLARYGVVARLEPDSTHEAAQAELISILETTGLRDWNSLVDVSMVQERLHQPFISFGFALGMAVIIVCVALRPRLSYFCAFFFLKTGLSLLALLLAGLEFTGATRITLTGGTDLSAEPLSTWIFLLSSMGLLTWSVLDQRRRCRVCFKRLGLAAHVGCPGRILLDWAGTELVCIEGHGMLHVPEMVSSWQEPERWTTLDESWTGLFQ